MEIIKQLFRLIKFFASFIGALLISSMIYFFLNKPLSYDLIIGLIILEIVLFLTRTNTYKIKKALMYAKKKHIDETSRKKFAQSIKNKIFSGYIARAILISFIITQFEYILVVFTSLFCIMIILSEMSSKKLSLFKIVMSTLLGTLSGLIAVIISNFLI